MDQGAWDSLDHGPSPFLRWGFLRALEESESVGDGTGWSPYYLLAESGGELLGAIAAFVKTDSYGEYIFDWGWAHSCERARIPYYPKLVIAAPVTPATGRRLLIAPGADFEEVSAVLAAAVLELAEKTDCMSVHWLFCTADECERLVELGFAERASYQFHWHNRDYECFDDFLGRLSSRKRKQFRKERLRAKEQIERFDFLRGSELSRRDLKMMDRLYRRNVYAHGGYDYLRPGFFERLIEHMPDEVVFGRVQCSGRSSAGAIFLETDQALYGRYWGCDREMDMMHFEVAYYAGIERCIERKLPLFEAGAQGEHKLLRGFEPSRTYSCHTFRHSGIDRAIRQFLEDERREVAARIRRLAEYGPYRCPPTTASD